MCGLVWLLHSCTGLCCRGSVGMCCRGSVAIGAAEAVWAHVCCRGSVGMCAAEAVWACVLCRGSVGMCCAEAVWTCAAERSVSMCAAAEAVVLSDVPVSGDDIDRPGDGGTKCGCCTPAQVCGAAAH